MRTHTASAGMSLFFRVPIISLFGVSRLIIPDSTLIWAIDMDDGTSIDALGSAMSRPKAKVVDPLQNITSSASVPGTATTAAAATPTPTQVSLS